MLLRFALVVSPVRQIRPDVRAPLQTRASHAEPDEDRVGQLFDVETERFGSGSLFDGELQQAEAFARIAVARAGIEVCAQLLVGFDEPEVVETGGVGQRHACRDDAPGATRFWNRMSPNVKVGVSARSDTGSSSQSIRATCPQPSHNSNQSWPSFPSGA